MLRIVFLSLVFSSMACAAGTGKKLEIFVSIAPQKFLVEKIGGDRVHVNVMLQTGQSPETFDPAPKQIAMLSETQVYFRIGVPFENHWMTRMTAQNTRMRVVNCCDSMLFNNDPHVWTDPYNIRIIAARIRETLNQLDPGGASLFDSNYRMLITDLDRLDQDIRALLSRRRTNYFIVSHGSWGYYARHYGLNQLALESLGRELGPRGMSELVELAKSEAIHTIFIQQQHPARTAYTLARELDAKVISIDPLAEDYIGNMYSITRQIAEALR